MVKDRVRMPYGFMVTKDEWWFITENDNYPYTSKEIIVKKKPSSEKCKCHCRCHCDENSLGGVYECIHCQPNVNKPSLDCKCLCHLPWENGRYAESKICIHCNPNKKDFKHSFSGYGMTLKQTELDEEDTLKTMNIYADEKGTIHTIGYAKAQSREELKKEVIREIEGIKRYE